MWRDLPATRTISVARLWMWKESRPPICIFSLHIYTSIKDEGLAGVQVSNSHTQTSVEQHRKISRLCKVSLSTESVSSVTDKARCEVKFEVVIAIMETLNVLQLVNLSICEFDLVELIIGVGGI